MIEKYITALNEREPLTFLNIILGIPLNELAEEIGVTQSWLSHCIAGRRKLTQHQKVSLMRIVDECLDAIAKHSDPLAQAVITFGEDMA